MLKDWIENRVCIANQKRGSRQSRGATKGKESRLEETLFEEFKEGRKVGKAIGCQWFQCYAKAIYRQQYPQRVTQNESGRLIYAGFKFSNGWF
jgi:hypothetical protein